MKRIFFLPATGTIIALITACAPTIQVSTPEPVKIDVTMRVDVHQKTDEAKPKASESEVTPLAARRRERSGQIQNLKNNRFIGEGKDGYLQVVQAPPGNLETGENYAEYAKRLVLQENNDRRLLNMQVAERQGTPLEIVERESAKRWRENSFPGEWIQKDDGKWIQR